MSSKQDNTNLYRVLERGDRKIASAHQNGILLVGLTRAGKSTTFNWVLKKHLVGVGDEVDAHYQNVVEQDHQAAQLGDTYTSVTLCPNVVEFDKINKITLIDMAGYKDKRDYIGVLGVSYFLKAVFEQVKKVKFIIVLGEDKLAQKSGDGIISTFTGFLNMFNIQNMDAKIKGQFYSSISMCITRSQNPTKHAGYLRRILTQLKDEKLIVQKKDEVVSLIQYIIGQNRIEAFESAVADTNAPKCEMVERFDQMGWRFLDIAKSEAIIKKELISLPFKKDYEDLKKDQKDLVDAVIAKRVNSYLQFSKILNSLIRSFEQNWAYCLDKWSNQNQFQLNLTNYQFVFQHIRQFLNENDFYNSDQLLPPQIKIDYGTSLNLIKTIKKIIQIYSIADLIGDQQDSFINNMAAYTGLFEQLIKCIYSFANSEEHERLLLRLSFIIKRGFRQFSKLYQINPNAIHDVSQKMKDNCNLIFQEKRKEFIQRFITRIDDKLMRKIFNKIDDLLEYEEFFNNYQNEFRRQYKEFYFFSEHRNNIEITKAGLYINEGKKTKAVRCYIRAFRSVCEIADQINKSNKSQDQIQVQLNQFYMKKLYLIGNITSLLITFKDIPQAIIYALTLCTHTKNISQACQIYEIIIEEAQDLAIKLEKIGQYADYCLDWGRYEKASILLQKKLFLEKQNFENYMNTIKKLSIVASQQKQYLSRYYENLQSWSRLPQEDKQLDGYLQELEFIVPDQ